MSEMHKVKYEIYEIPNFEGETEPEGSGELEMSGDDIAYLDILVQRIGEDYSDHNLDEIFFLRVWVDGEPHLGGEYIEIGWQTRFYVR